MLFMLHASAAFKGGDIKNFWEHDFPQVLRTWGQLHPPPPTPIEGGSSKFDGGGGGFSQYMGSMGA